MEESMEYKITVTDPGGSVTYRTFRQTTDDSAVIVRDELNMRPDPGTKITVEVLG
jgi:hypothetical protein